MVRLTFALAWLVMSGTAALAETRLSAAERGRALYLDGRHADDRPFVATTGAAAVPLPPAFLACVNCHGYDARGKTEGGVTTSDLRWDTLASPYEFTRADGRRRAPYDEDLFLGALTRGLDSSGRPLDPAMPRYDLSAAEAADLVAYLKQIDRPTDEGVTDDTIRLGLALPGDPTASALTAADRQLVAAWFDAVNRRGGIFRRQIELVMIDPVTDPDVPVLVILDADAAPPSRRASWAGQRRPFLSLTADAARVGGRYGFALFPGAEDLDRVLARHPGLRPAIVRPALATDLSAEALAAYAACAPPGPLTADDRLHQWALLGAARILGAALENAGRDLDREALVAALESLRALPTGFTRPGGFSAGSHVFLSGAYLVPLATANRSEPEWVPLRE